MALTLPSLGLPGEEEEELLKLLRAGSRSGSSADFSAFAGGGVAFAVAVAGTGFFTATGALVYGGPGAAFGFLFAKSAVLVTFLDMFGLAFLLVRIRRFIASWHDDLLGPDEKSANKGIAESLATPCREQMFRLDL
jgi:hypothetical protein